MEMTVPAIYRLRKYGGLLVAFAVALALPPAAQALPGIWIDAGDLTVARYAHTATLLPSGKVLVTGDVSSSAITDLYDPTSNSWTAAANIGTGRAAASASLLSSGNVLVAGGNAANNCTTTFTGSGSTTVCYAANSAELYTPAGNVWNAAGTLLTPRQGHTATLLTSGKLLVAGGASDCTTVIDPVSEIFYCTYVAGAELYDPASNSWSAVGTLANPRTGHVATLLASGKVLLTGGRNNSGILTSAELYDPISNTWSAAASLNAARSSHTATLLPSGKVYVAGGSGSTGSLASAELYDPVSNSWSAAANLTTARTDHTATLLPSGKVMLAAGDVFGSTSLVANPDLYDPTNNTIAVASSLITPRYGHTATLLNTGKVLVAGGFNADGETSSAELFDLANNTYTVTASVGANGSITPPTQIVNGGGSVSFTVTPSYGASIVSVSGDTCTVTQTDATTWTTNAITADCTVTASFLGPMSSARYQHTATLLASGKVLIAGGSASKVADLFDPVTKTWSAGGTMLSTRYLHTATLLPSGEVLVAGGEDNVGHILATTELYDPVSNSWSAGGSLSFGRFSHAAALLSTGKVLVVGSDFGGPVEHAELYNPSTNMWSAATAPSSDRAGPTATVLSSGKVLVVGGGSSTTDLYNPTANTWSAGGVLPSAAYAQGASLLSSGKVLLTGGQHNGSIVATTALYDPTGNSWSAAASMISVRQQHTATLLSTGKVLVLGGYIGGNTAFAEASAELYDAVGNTWISVTSLTSPRYGHTSTLLPTGKILVAGGQDGTTGAVPSAELYGSVTPDSIFRNGFE